MAIRNVIRRWLLGPDPNQIRRQDKALGDVCGSGYRPDVPPAVRVEVIEAVNGRVLNVGVYKPNPHGPDWTHHLYVVRDGEALPDAIATVLVITQGGK